VKEDGTYEIIRWGRALTNNEAEYQSLRLAVLKASEGDVIYMDSQLVVNQVNELWKIKNPKFFKYFFEIKKVIEEKNLEVLWIPREKNKAGHILEGDEK